MHKMYCKTLIYNSSLLIAKYIMHTIFLTCEIQWVYNTAASGMSMHNLEVKFAAGS